MKFRRSSLISIAKAILILAGFAAGLINEKSGAGSFSTLQMIFASILIILLLPFLVLAIFRLNVASGFFEPPWTSPCQTKEMNPLSAVQLGSFVCFAVGIGAVISSAWRGLAAINYALLGFSGGFGLYLSLLRLDRLYSFSQSNAKVQH